MALTDNVDLALRSAPEAIQDPTLALAAGSAAGDPQQNAEVTAHLAKTNAQQQAVDQVSTHHGGHGLLGSTLSWLGQGVSSAEHFVGSALQKVGAVASMPLQDIQHQYRYLRDVESQHGWGAMFLQAMPLLAGSTIGGIVAGPEGIALGAEGAGALFDRFMGYDDSWKRTASSTYVDPRGGQQVSPGRDVARGLDALLSHVGVHIENHKGFDLFDAVSAAGDGIFDLTADPLAQLAGVRRAAVSEEGAGGLLRARWGGIGMGSADVVTAATQYPSVGKAFEHIASIDDPAAIIRQYPKFTGLAPQLAAADTADKVGQVFVDNADAAAMQGRLLPRRTIGTTLFGPATQTLREAASQAALKPAADEAGIIGRTGAYLTRQAGEAYKRVTTMLPVSTDPVTGAIDRDMLHFSDPKSSQAVYEWAKWGHTEGTAQALAASWAKGTIQDKMNIYRNIVVDNVANRMEAVQPGWTKTADGLSTVRRLGDEVDQHLGGIDAGRVTPFGFDEDGRIISKHEYQGQTVTTPILEGDVIKAPIPNYLDYDRDLKALGNGSKLYGKVDDFLYNHFTQSVFKRWALASGGFAMRVASGELLPYLYRDGADVFRSRIATSLADRGWTSLQPGEVDHIGAGVVRFMASKAGVTDEQIGALADNIKYLNGSTISPAVSTAHTGGQEIIGAREYTHDGVYRLLQETPKSVRVTEDPMAWGPEHDDQWLFHQKQAEDLGKSPAMQASAKEYSAAIDEGASKAEASHRASLAAKRQLDMTPEETLQNNLRHYYATSPEGNFVKGVVAEGPGPKFIPGEPGTPGHFEYTGETEMVGRTEQQGSLFPTEKRPEMAWIPGEEGAEGHWERTGRMVETGQWSTQRPLVNEAGNIPGGLREPGTQYGFGPEGTPSTTTYKEERWVPGIEGKQGHWEYTGQTTEHPMETAQQSLLPGTEVKKTRWVPGQPATPGSFEGELGRPMGPQLLEQQTLPTDPRMLDAGYVDPKSDPHYDWGRVMTEYLKGTVYGADGTLHSEILNAIAEGRTPDTDFMKNIPTDSRPNRIMGAFEKPAAPNRLNDMIFRRLNAVINWMSREPIYNAEYLKQYEGLLPHIESGSLTHEEAQVLANTRAVEETLPHIHNINERSLMSEHARNFIPFYFAQQQSYARMFRLLSEDPQAFRRIQLTYSNLANFGGVYDDNTGNSHVVMPGLGFLTGGAMGALSAIGVPVTNSLPTAFSGSLSSLASISPFLEGSDVLRPGPLVALGMRAIQNLLPEAGGVKAGFTNLESSVVGSQTMAQQAWQMLVPNTAVRNAMQAFMPMDNRTETKSVLDAIQSLSYQQNVAMSKYLSGGEGRSADDPQAPHITPRSTDTPLQQQQFIDRVKNTARILSFTKAIVSAFSPTSPSVQIGDYKLKTELYDLMKANDPATGKPYGISGAITEFLVRHPDATPYTVFETDSGTSSPIQSTHPAQQWVTKNMNLLTDSRYSSAASYFVPQSNDKFNQSIYNEQMAMGLRSSKAPDQMIQDINVAEGNRWYFDQYKPARDAALAKAVSPHDKTVISHQWSTQGGVDAAGNQIMSLNQMKLQNPIWYDNFSSGGRIVRRDVAIQQMRTGLQDGVFKDSAMTPLLTQLLARYDEHASAMLPGRSDSFATAQRNAEKVRWQSSLKAIADAHPELDMAINNIFRGV